MTHSHRIVKPGRIQGVALSEAGKQLTPPHGWLFLPAGDAAVTRSVKAKGPTWVVQIKRGRRLIAKGVWAEGAHVLAAQEEVAAKRATPEYAKRRKGDLARRAAKHEAYVAEFCAEVLVYLDFHPKYQTKAKSLAKQVTAHATPVGSGTVARTKRISVDKRAEAAVIAWMRHQTTAYDTMSIARIKGRRREVRRQLAAKSITLLSFYRKGGAIPVDCPLRRVLR